MILSCARQQTCPRVCAIGVTSLELSPAAPDLIPRGALRLFRPTAQHCMPASAMQGPHRLAASSPLPTLFPEPTAWCCRPASATEGRQPTEDAFGAEASKLQEKAALRRFQRAAREVGHKAHPVADEVKDVQNRAGMLSEVNTVLGMCCTPADGGSIIPLERAIVFKCTTAQVQGSGGR